MKTTTARKLIAAVTAATVAFALAACAPSGPAETDSLTLNLGRDAASAPDVTYGGDPWNHSLNEPLWRYVEGGDAVPRLATDWEYNDEGTELAVTLREGLLDSAGNPIDAEAIKTWLEYYKTTPLAARYDTIDEVEVTSDTTFVFHLNTYSPLQFQILGGDAIISPAQIELIQAEDPIASEAPISTGPYVLDDAESSDDYWVMHLREDYWDADSYDFDTVTVKLMGDLVARVNALKAGEIDLARVELDSVEALSAEGFSVVEQPILWSGLSLYDSDGNLNPALGDVRVRQAINYSFDREAINEAVYHGLGTPTAQPFFESSDYWVDGAEYEYDPEKAKELLADAGYPDGFELSIINWGGDPILPIVVQSLADIGITATVTTPPDFATLLAEGANSSALLFLDCLCSTVDAHMEADGIFNFLHRSDPDLSALITTSTDGSATPEDRAEAQQAIGQFAFDEAWFAIIASQPFVFAVADGLEVVGDGGSGFVPLNLIKVTD